MGLSLRWAFAYLILLLSTICQAYVSPESGSFFLQKRQDFATDDPVNSNCVALCDISTCGSECPVTRRRRSFSLGTEYTYVDVMTPQFNLSDGTRPALNLTTGELLAPDDRDELVKRIFKINPVSPRPLLQYAQSSVAHYLSQQIGTLGTFDNQYGGLEGFFDTTLATVTHQATFGATGFQFETFGLHGCTMLTIISNRAVWMAHFWEMFTTDGNDDAGGANWQVRAINAVTGNGVQETVFPRNGPALNPALFNQPGDNTIAIFMTPLNDTCKAAETKMGATEPTDLKYNIKTQEMITALRPLLPGAAFVRWGYHRLDYKKAREKAQAGTNERGAALFQYDPDADGNGNRAYRLFYQQNVYPPKPPIM